MVNESIGLLQDAQQSIKQVGQHALFCRGHVSSTVGTDFNSSQVKNPDYTSLRPVFRIQIHPVASLTDIFGHIGSRNYLIGRKFRGV